MLALYRTAWRCVSRAPTLFLLGAALFLAVDVHRAATDDRVGGTVVAWFAFVYGLHRAALLGEGWRGQALRPDAPKQAIAWFLLVALLLVGAGLLVPVGLLAWTLTNVDIPRDLLGGFALLLILVFVVAYALVLSVFGTALPASAVRDRFSLRLTLWRGRRTAPGVLAGLVMGPGLFWMLSFGVQVGLANLIGPAFALHRDETGFNWVALLWRFPIGLLDLFNATLTVAVLCHAYRKVAPPEVAAQLVPDPQQTIPPQAVSA